MGHDGDALPANHVTCTEKKKRQIYNNSSLFVNQHFTYCRVTNIEVIHSRKRDGKLCAKMKLNNWNMEEIKWYTAMPYVSIVTFLMAWTLAASWYPIMLFGAQIFRNGKSDCLATCAAIAVFPLPGGPVNRCIDTVQCGLLSLLQWFTNSIMLNTHIHKYNALQYQRQSAMQLLCNVM